MAEVFGGDFSKDGKLRIGRGIWSRGFPETGLSGVGWWGMNYFLGGAVWLAIYVSWGVWKIMQFG
ncbi:MAG: hypothetical protein EAZ18_01560 [Oscillatoriales cyanobacterium]|nr:MAG: hypothetical protein EAZ18_01560 [Oscillatoriales cyanobacterium]